MKTKSVKNNNVIPTKVGIQTLCHNPFYEEWIINKHEHRQIVVLFTQALEDPVYIHCDLVSEGASVDIIGIILLEALPVLKIDLNVIHSAPTTKSTITMVSVLQGNAAQDIEGRIVIHKGAKGADGFFSHRTLTLSATAKSTTIPSLEIEEDDVKASHAGVTGPIDPEQLFYLQSRGLNAEEAQRVIAEGFLEQVIQRIQDEAIRNKVLMSCHPDGSRDPDTYLDSRLRGNDR